MKQIRIRQLLNLYNKSYTNRERWTAERDKALAAQHPKAAIKADTAAHYWDITKNRLYVSLLIATPPCKADGRAHRGAVKLPKPVQSPGQPKPS